VGSEVLAWVGLVCYERDDEELDDVPGVLKQPWLAEVGGVAIDNGMLTAEETEVIAGCHYLAPLGRLDLGRDVLDADRLRQACASPHVKNVAWLNLTDNYLGNAGISVLAGSSLMQTLHRLDVDENNIGARGAKALAQATAPRLQHLVLSG